MTYEEFLGKATPQAKEKINTFSEEQTAYLKSWVEEAPEPERNVRDFSEMYGFDYTCDIYGNPKYFGDIHIVTKNAPEKSQKAKEMIGENGADK